MDEVIGILLERLDGEFASIDNLSGCEDALRRFHDIGLIHGDPNRYNFIVDKQSGLVRMVDYEHTTSLDEESAKAELQSLASELREETERGGVRDIVVESDNAAI